MQMQQLTCNGYKLGFQGCEFAPQDLEAYVPTWENEDSSEKKGVASVRRSLAGKSHKIRVRATARNRLAGHRDT